MYVERFNTEYAPTALLCAIFYGGSFRRETKRRRKGSETVFRMVPCPFKKKLNDCYYIPTTSSYFFPKKDMILPWPGLPPAFLPFAIDDAAVDAGVLSLEAGSSSEKDSHAGSSFVTMDDTN